MAQPPLTTSAGAPSAVAGDPLHRALDLRAVVVLRVERGAVVTAEHGRGHAGLPGLRQRLAVCKPPPCIDLERGAGDMNPRNPVTRLVVGAALAASIGVAAVLAQGDGPPPPRTFGPDTTTVGVFTGQGTTAPGLQCDAPTDPSTALERSGVLASSLDGPRLDVTVRVPQSAGPHPLIVYVHGWGGSKSAGRDHDTGRRRQPQLPRRPVPDRLP